MQNVTLIIHKWSVNVLQDNSQTQIHETEKKHRYCLILQYINNLVTTQNLRRNIVPKPAKPVQVYLHDSVVLFM